MAWADSALSDIERNAALARAALAASVTDIADRLRPTNLVAAASREVGRKAAEVTGDFGETVRKHGGQAALFGAGALLAFDVGRMTRERRPRQTLAEAMTNGAGPRGDFTRTDAWTPLFGTSHRSGAPTLGAVDKVKAWAAPVAGLALGYAVAGAFGKTQLEAEAFGTMASDLRNAAEAFKREHAQGAKQAAAEAFGIAKLTAAALGVMAALARYLSPASRADPAERAVNPSAHYDGPDDVVRDVGLSREQREAALDELELDARLMQTADDEGMGGGEPSAIVDVAQAKAEVGTPPLPKHA